MSMVYCFDCHQMVDTDVNLEHFDEHREEETTSTLEKDGSCVAC